MYIGRGNYNSVIFTGKSKRNGEFWLLENNGYDRPGTGKVGRRFKIPVQAIA